MGGLPITAALFVFIVFYADGSLFIISAISCHVNTARLFPKIRQQIPP
jgi:hypothetical protein